MYAFSNCMYTVYQFSLIKLYKVIDHVLFDEFDSVWFVIKHQ